MIEILLCLVAQGPLALFFMSPWFILALVFANPRSCKRRPWGGEEECTEGFGGVEEQRKKRLFGGE